MLSPLNSDQQDLAAQYLPLARALARPLKARYPGLADEFDSACGLAIVEAARAYDPARNLGFATYLRFRVKGALWDCLRSEGLADDGDELPRVFRMHALDEAGSIDSGAEAVDALDSFDRWVSVLGDRQAAIIRAIYLHNRTQSQVAEQLGISQTEASRIHRQALDLLSGRESKRAIRRRRRARADETAERPLPLPALAG